MSRSMLALGVVFLAAALIAGLLGLGVVSGESWLVAKVCSFVFLVPAVLSFVWGWLAHLGATCCRFDWVWP